MVQHLGQMPSLSTLASALCHIATIAVVMQKHTDLSSTPGLAGRSHRNLESTAEPPDDPLAKTVAQLEKAVDTQGAQLHALRSEVHSLVEDLQEIRESKPGPQPEPEAELGLNTTRRQAQQGAAGDCDASGVCTARIITRTVVMQSAMTMGGGTPHRGRRAQATPCDLATQSPAVMAACCVATGGGHRRAQADCPLPEVCPSARCAEVFQPFYDSCRANLEVTPELGAGLAALAASCNEVQGGSSLAHQLNLQCTDAFASAEDCVPPCNAEYHGYMLLLNFDGDDSKFSCNLAHGLYAALPAFHVISVQTRRYTAFSWGGTILCAQVLLGGGSFRGWVPRLGLAGLLLRSGVWSSRRIRRNAAA